MAPLEAKINGLIIHVYDMRGIILFFKPEVHISLYRLIDR
jgi:hypothetical protein